MRERARSLRCGSPPARSLAGSWRFRLRPLSRCPMHRRSRGSAMLDSPSLSGERQLVRRAQQMDEEALSAIFNLYYPKIFRFGMSHLGNVHAAEDLASDVMLKMLDSIHRYRFLGPPFSAWVFRIARNRLVDVLRKSRGPRSQGVDLNE